MVCSTDAAFSRDLNAGQEYETWVYRWFFEHFGKVIKPLPQNRWQCSENDFGLEIKLDRKWRQTNHLYIEVSDKVDGGGGIWRQGTNTRWWLLGDFSGFWVFRLSVLRSLDKMMIPEVIPGRPLYHHVGNRCSNSRGYLLPVEEADSLSALRWRLG